MQNYTITAFYKFFDIGEQNKQAVRDSMFAKGEELNLLGLTLVAHEGINGTIAGSAEAIAEYKQFLESIAGEIAFKDSFCNEAPFKRWFVKLRKEIVAIGDPNMHPSSTMNHHITPQEWNAMMEEEDVIVLDTRNTYETAIGTFKGAIDPKLSSFDQFPEYVKNSGIPKDKKVLMFCTGGIRCEKALIEMKNQGYEHVYQLQGGILEYFAQSPHTNFEGECFVFDHRTAVDQNLAPSTKYKTCPHCGDPGDQSIQCTFCTNDCTLCQRCRMEKQIDTCSKDCRERLRRKQAKATSASAK
jgi:UPF0176 protein